MSAAASRPLCPVCDGPLEADGPCLACFFKDAVGAAPSAGDVTAPGADIPGFASLGRPVLPKLFAKHRLLREIGHGGMGIVYEAEDLRLKRTVALKLVRSAAFARPEELSRFRAEAETVARLDHPNIVPVHEIGEADGQQFFTMKLMDGGSLAERLLRGPLPPREAAGLLSTIARAVHHAHQRGVLHRDLKPGNVLFDAHGQPHLTDFGLAKLVHVESSLTLSSAQLGTPHYMSPEQAAGRVREISTASDVWALGVMLHQSLSGRVPFVGESHAEIFRRIQDEEPPSLAGKGAGADRPGRPVPADLATLCLRCMEKEPARRPAGAGELADELDRWLRGEPIRSRPVTSLERAVKWGRRNRRLSVLGAALLSALVAGSVVSTVLWRRAEAARGLAERNAARAVSGAVAARAAERLAADNAYFATLAQALATRERGDLGYARQLLAGLPSDRRGFEWRLLRWLCRGDEARRFGLADVRPRCLAWEPVRQRVAVLGEDRVLRWLDPADGAMEAGPTVPDRFAGHAALALEKGFHQLAFSPDGRHFLCGDGDVVIIAETASGRVLHSAANRHMGGVWLDDRRVLYAGNTVWAATSGEPGALFDILTGVVEKLPGRIYAPLALSPDRTLLAWSRDRPDGIRVEVLSVPDLVRVAAGTASPLHAFTPDVSPALLAFAPDQTHLGMAQAGLVGQPRSIAVFALGDPRPRFSMDLGVAVHALAFSPDAAVLAVATDDRTLRTFRHLRPTPATATYDDDTLPGLAQPVPASGPRMPPVDLLSRSAFDGQIQFLLGHEGAVRDLAFLPGPHGLATVGSDRTLRRWPLTAAAAGSRVGGVWTWNSWEHPAMSADGRFALYRTETNRTWLWDRRSGRRVPLAEGDHPLAVRRDGRAVTRRSGTDEIVAWAAPGDSDAMPAELWRVKGIPAHPGFSQVVRGVLAPDDRTLVGLLPGKLLVTDLEARTTTGTDDQRMLYGASAVNCAAISPDGRLVAVTGLLGRHARLYRTSDINGGFVSLGDAADYDTAVAFHPDGRRLFVGNEDGQVRVFDVSTRAELAGEGWRAQSGAVTALAVSSDGRVVATSGDLTLQLWDALPEPDEARRLRLRLNVPAPRNWMRFSADDTTFLHVAPGHALEAWEAPR